ncbi:ABC transporter permease [Paenibacillus flagellatus]|uniref:ABC3 transporter permease C-terminal domain-containing protein n=1 Tax=Paenibacillus flagellatus TaxID=2211139 RepID=A0A2V5KBN1_9BACL|nr:ABC transporter permease [Paenibacillus flagellatus]PYI55544.1 hypothetical protein DLM86_07370 [Paenibacillus flagellatus]
MVMVIDKRIKRVFLENKAPYIGSMLLIALSCFLFTCLVAMGGNLSRLTYQFETKYAQEDASFTTVRSIGRLEELEAAADARIEEGRMFDYTLSEGITLRLFSKNDRINLPAVLEGKPLGGKGDILLNPAFAAAHEVKIGDVLKIADRSFTVAGLMALPNYIYPLRSETDILPQLGFGIAVIGKEDFASLWEGNRFYSIKFNPSEINPRARSAAFIELLRSRGIEVVQWTDIDGNNRVRAVTNKLASIDSMGRVVPTAILLLASILIGNILGRMIKRESAIAGALYALGYTKKEIYRHYLRFPFAIAAMGGILGTALGLLTVRPGLLVMLDSFDIPLTGIDYNPLVIILSLLLPVALLGSSGWFVIRKQLERPPVELMKGDRDKSKVHGLERMFKLDSLKFAAKFQIREQLRSLSRLTLLLAGVAAATLLLLFGFFLKSGMDYFLTAELKNASNFKYEYLFKSLRTGPTPAGSEPYAVSSFTAKGDDSRAFNVIGVLPDSAMLNVEDATGAKLWIDRVLITKPIAERLKVKPGDTITVIRKADYRPFSLRVGGIADSYNKSILMPLEEYNETFGMPKGSYSALFSKARLDLPDDELISALSLDDKIDAVRESMAPLTSMVVFVSAVAFMIAVMIIYVVTSMMIEENKSTISLLKIFGYRKREINSLILNSSTFVVAIGYIVGIPISFAAMGGLMQTLENSAPFAMPVKIDPLYIGVGFAAVMLSYELSKLLCKRKVNAVSMSEALKAGTES